MKVIDLPPRLLKSLFSSSVPIQSLASPTDDGGVVFALVLVSEDAADVAQQTMIFLKAFLNSRLKMV